MGYVEPPEETALSVAELVGLARETLETAFADVLVAGELASWSTPASGHRYFTLKDDEAAIDCVLWRADARRLAFVPTVGDEVLVRGRVGVFEKSGRMQLYVRAMKPVGAGAAQRALEELKRRLTEEGLFAVDRKRPLPWLPSVIGVVTSASGAALHDILTTLERRFPPFHVVLAPASVQGSQAPRQIVRALARLARDGRADVVIVGRGGGSSEDLAAFNDEAVVRAVAAFPVPVVSAVGHEVDISLCDLAADLRAATPTAAAEAVVPVYEELLESLQDLRSRLHAGAQRLIRHQRARVDALGAALPSPALGVAQARQATDQLAVALERALAARARLAERALDRARARLASASRRRSEALRRRVDQQEVELRRALEHGVATRARRLATLSSGLDALSPLAVLDRGYSLARDPRGRLVRDAREIATGDELALRFRRGSARARVLTVEESES